MPYMWLNWNPDDSITVLESKGENILSEGTYELSKLVPSNEIPRLNQFKKNISDQISQIDFMIDMEGTQHCIQCTAVGYSDEIQCVWSPKLKDDSIAFLQNAAHDFRTPLGSIMGFVNLLKNMFQSGKPIDQESASLYLDMIKVSTDKALDLTAEIMELAEMESDTFKLNVDQIVVTDFVKRYLETHRLITFKKNIKINFNSESEKAASINELKLTRAMDNVMSNAVKFSNNGSQIAISVKEHNDQITICIRDYGIGMNQEILDVLFQKFGKAKRSGLDGETSHGLGMSIVRQIMILHGGSVDVRSEEGLGTEVSLNLKVVE